MYVCMHACMHGCTHKHTHTHTHKRTHTHTHTHRSSVIQELTKQKRASDDMLRRLEGKLISAGVDPSDIEKVSIECVLLLQNVFSYYISAGVDPSDIEKVLQVT